MRVFITGASGFVGSAVVRELIQAGHQVVGLARSDAAARAVAASGATPHRGDLDDLPGLQRGAAGADAVIHAGFVHDFSNFKASCELDRRVIAALGDALAGSSRPLLVTSALGILPPGQLATEQTRPPSPSTHPRVASEEAARLLMERGLNVAIVRLPPSVHGEGDRGGFVPTMIRRARETRASAYIGEGANRWPAVHRLDAAPLYRLALERGTPGACYHAVAEEGVPFRQIAEAIGRQLHVPVVSVSKDEAAAHFTPFVAHFAALDLTASSHTTREQLAWRPTHPGLIADLHEPHYVA